MKRVIWVTVVALAVALVAPTFALAKKGKHHGQARAAAAQACKAERAELGKEAFRAKYGPRARRACMRGAKSEVKNAAQECKAEREQIGVDAFRELYGTNHNHHNAFGKCVVSKVHAAIGDEPTGDEPAGDEPTGDEPTGDEPTGDEPTGDEQPPVA